MRINNEDLLSIDGVRAEVDLDTDVQLKPVWLGHILNFSVQLVFTGTPDGEFYLEVSSDKGQPNAASEPQKYEDVENWTRITGSERTVSAAGNLFYDVALSGAEWVRVGWTATSPGTSPVLTSARAKVKGV